MPFLFDVYTGNFPTRSFRRFNNSTASTSEIQTMVAPPPPSPVAATLPEPLSPEATTLTTISDTESSTSEQFLPEETTFIMDAADSYQRQLENRINNVEQISRNRNVIILGIPQCQSKELMDVIQDIFNYICFRVNARNIVDIAHRLPRVNNQQGQPILVQFNSRKARNDFVLVSRCRPKFTAIKLGFNVECGFVFINEHLSSGNVKLFFETRKFKKEFGYKFCWIRDAKVYLRKSAKSISIRVKSLDDLDIMRDREFQLMNDETMMLK